MEKKRVFYLQSSLFLALSLLISSVSLAQSVPDFSGTWSYNESKSNLGEGGFRMISQKITITQNERILALERSFKGQDGEERKTTETYTLDGKESVNPVFNTSKKSKAIWSGDKKYLTVSSEMIFEMNGEKTEIKTVEIYKLTDENKLLSIDSRSISTRGERKATLVYDKN